MDTETAGIKNIKIAIASGKGGTGKTLVATNMFYSLMLANKKVTLVDCDAEAPNDILFFKKGLHYYYNVYQKVPVVNEKNCTFCGKCNEYCNYNAIFILPVSKVINIIEELCHDCGACIYACKDNALTEKNKTLGKVNHYEISGSSSIVEAISNIGIYSPVSLIKSAINEAGKEGIIILDSPPGTSCPFIQTVNQADHVILVAEPTPFGLSDLKQSVDTLKTMNKKYSVIINKAGTGNNEIYKYLKKEDINILHEIPFDKKIAEIYSKGELIVNHNKKYKQMFSSIIELVS